MLRASSLMRMAVLGERSTPMVSFWGNMWTRSACSVSMLVSSCVMCTRRISSPSCRKSTPGGGGEEEEEEEMKGEREREREERKGERKTGEEERRRRDDRVTKGEIERGGGKGEGQRKGRRELS